MIVGILIKGIRLMIRRWLGDKELRGVKELEGVKEENESFNLKIEVYS